MIPEQGLFLLTSPNEFLAWEKKCLSAVKKYIGVKRLFLVSIMVHFVKKIFGLISYALRKSSVKMDLACSTRDA